MAGVLVPDHATATSYTSTDKGWVGQPGPPDPSSCSEESLPSCCASSRSYSRSYSCPNCLRMAWRFRPYSSASLSLRAVCAASRALLSDT